MIVDLLWSHGVMSQLVGARLISGSHSNIFRSYCDIERCFVFIFLFLLGDILLSRDCLLDYFSALDGFDNTSLRKGLFTS